MHPLSTDLPVAPYRLSGTVVGALLNDPAQLAALGEAATQPPYKAPPRAPVLEVKPRHMLAGDGATVRVPAGHDALEAGASLAVLIGRTACRVEAAQALSHVAGYLLAGDFSLPLASHYRPSVRLKARDGFCPVGAFVAAAALPDPDALTLVTSVEGRIAQTATTAGRVRGVARLIADVSGFMTLHPGDLLLLGRSHGTPSVQAGQSVVFSAEGIGTLRCRVEADAEVPA